MSDNETIQEEFEQRLNRIISERSGQSISPLSHSPSIKKVMPNRLINNKPMQQVVVKPQSFIFGLYIAGLVYAACFGGFIFYKSQEMSPGFIMLAFVVVFVGVILKHINRKVTIDHKGILFNKDFTPWQDIIECYTTQYVMGRAMHDDFFILLTTGAYKEYDLGAIYPTELSCYVYKFKSEYEAGVPAA